MTALKNVKPTVGKKDLEDCEKFTKLFGSQPEEEGEAEEENKVTKAVKRTADSTASDQRPMKRKRGDV